MPTLSARFNVELTAPCLLELPDDMTPTVAAIVQGFDVSVRLISEDGQKGRFHGDQHWTTRLGSLEILVSRDESDLPPAVITQANGRRDLTELSAWLRPKLPQFKATALEAANRVLNYFKFALSAPLVKPTPSWLPGLNNPTWIDDSGAELPTSIFTAGAQPIPGWNGELGVQKLTMDRIASLETFLSSTYTPELPEQLISDAQAAWFEGNLRRAVLELAICTEITVKRLFFSAASPAGAAYDYLEDKAKVSVRVLELLDAVASEAFSQSFKQFDLGSYRHIDHLFRCRNKIAHRGDLSYRADSGSVIAVDSSLVKDWWGAVAALRAWAKAL